MKKTIYFIFSALFILVLLFGRNAAAQTISTFAGTGVNGYSGDGGPAIYAEMNQPIVLAKDAVGNIYIGEGNGDVIRKVDLTGTITTFAGTGVYGYTGDGGQASLATFNGPDGLAFDAYGNLLITDIGNNVIRRIDNAGIISTIAGTGASGYTGDGGPASAATFNFPRDITIDAAGNMYICDWLNYALRKIDGAGKITTIAGNGSAGYTGDGGPASNAQIGLPYRTCFDAAGNLYLVDGTYSVIRKIDTEGIITTVVGTGTGGFSGDGGPAYLAQLNMPTAVMFDVDGKMYIADRGNDRIRNINAQGIIHTVAGIGIAGETGDGGPAINAEINKPFDLLFDDQNYLYFPDINGDKVRKMTPDPNLGTGPSMIKNNGIALSPNPNNGIFRVEGLLSSSNDENVAITVSNMLGQVVFTSAATAVKGKIDQTLRLDASLPGGIYFLNLKSLSETFTERFTIRK